jgi:DNA recombination protein RmuC
MTTEEGRLRPDAVVHLPGQKSIVVDAKVPLSAYLDALDAEDEGGKKARLREHARLVRKHVADLGSKAYWNQLQDSPEFVVMYVPIETAFEAAVQEDSSLIDYAVDQSVIPAGPLTLLAHLKAAAYGWRQERISENAARISDLGKELYDRLSTLSGHFCTVGKHLGAAVGAYNSTVGSLERRVLVHARRFKDLGAATGEDLEELEPVDVRPRDLHAGRPLEALPAACPSPRVGGELDGGPRGLGRRARLEALGKDHSHQGSPDGESGAGRVRSTDGTASALRAPARRPLGGKWVPGRG